VVSFAYTSLRGPSPRREVEPFTLALGASAWYLHGFCRLRGEFRLFRVSRIAELAVVDEHFDPRDRVPVPPIWQSFMNVEDFIDIRLRFGPQARLAALDSFEQDQLIQEPDGSILASFGWPATESPLRFILGFGPGVRIESPESLRNAFIAATEAIIRENSPARS